MTWAIRMKWGSYEPVEVVKETAKTVFYIDRGYRNRETRSDKNAFYEWRGDEETARQIVAKLISAKSEYDRRSGAAARWFADRRTEIFVSAQGMAPEGPRPKGSGSSELPSPVPEGNAP